MEDRQIFQDNAMGGTLVVDRCSGQEIRVVVDWDLYRKLTQVAMKAGLDLADVLDQALRSHIGDLQADLWATGQWATVRDMK